MEWFRWPPGCTLPPPNLLPEFVPAVAVRSQMSFPAPTNPFLCTAPGACRGRRRACRTWVRETSGILNEGLEEEEDSKRQHAFMLQQPHAWGDDRESERCTMTERNGGQSGLSILAHTHFFSLFFYFPLKKQNKTKKNIPASRYGHTKWRRSGF